MHNRVTVFDDLDSDILRHLDVELRQDRRGVFMQTLLQGVVFPAGANEIREIRALFIHLKLHPSYVAIVVAA